jgi:dTDP-4-amino-4,6-dideoxygalactose transaminase
MKQLPRTSIDLTTMKYAVGRPNIMNRELFMTRVEQILDTKILTNDGPFVRALENTVCSTFDVKHCVAVANATLGLEIVLQALDLHGEIIVPSFTFVATAHAVKRIGAQPVFCDISPTSLALDVEAVERLITERTTAIMPVNIYGGLADLDGFAALAEKYKLSLIYDSAHSLGTKWNNAWTSSFGDAEVFSLHATKFINGFEGGLITTNNKALADKCALIRNFSFTGYDQVEGFGTNAKVSEIHAAMALTNLECLDQILSTNETVFSWYQKYLPEAAKMLTFDSRITSNYQYIVVLLPLGIRDEVQKFLMQKQIFARKYFYPGVHQFDCYRDDKVSLPVTEDAAMRVLCLPAGQDIGVDDVRYICDVLAEAILNSLAC